MRSQKLQFTAALNVLIYSGLLWAVIACSSSARRVSDVVAEPKPTDNPSEQISTLESDINAAKENGVDRLSPTWYAASVKSLDRAKEIRREGGDFNEMFKRLAEGRVQISRAKDISQTSRSSLSDVIKVREEAIVSRDEAMKSGAIDLEKVQEQYASAEANFLKLAKSVEENDMKDVSSRRSEVIKEFRTAQTDAIRKAKLGPALRIIQQAKDEGAKKYAPKTLAYAEDQLKATDQFIISNPMNSSDIDAKSEETVFYAKRALRMTEQARDFDNKKPEEVALWVENVIFDVGNNLGMEDHRDLTFTEQVAQLQTSAKDRAVAGKGADALRSRTAKLESENQKAQAMVQHEEKIKQVASNFGSEEAEVFEQGDKVVIRLKGIQFPSGQSRLGQQNFTLLGKVQKVLTDFPNADVKVEGHTDSTGSVSVNEKLSQARADAVKQYLVTNSDVENLSAEGMGSKKPIASNQNAKGRAQNRRIDVVISTGRSAE